MLFFVFCFVLRRQSKLFYFISWKQFIILKKLGTIDLCILLLSKCMKKMYIYKKRLKYLKSKILISVFWNKTF